MRRRLLSGCALLVLAIAQPTLLRAQFQAPTEEELKMTSDPKAPGAVAVYLYREEIADDRSHLYSWYARIKVLNEKGRELATVRIPPQRGVFKVAAIQGRTIHSDGTAIPLSVKPEDLVDSKSGNDRPNTIVFTLPAVEAGSILEYRLELRYDEAVVFSPHWIIQQPYFIHKAHYSFRPGKDLMTNSAGDVLANLTWSVTPKQIEVEQVKGGISSISRTFRLCRMKIGCRLSTPSTGAWLSTTPVPTPARISGRRRESDGQKAWKGSWVRPTHRNLAHRIPTH